MRSLREEVALGCRVLEDQGHADMVWGHVSARDPEGRGAWMKASGWGLDEVTADRVLLVNRAGQVLEGEGRPHVEFPIHTEILAARPDVGAVVHTHPTHAIAFAGTKEPLRPIAHDGALFVPPDVPRFTITGDLIRSADLGMRLANVLGDHRAALIPHHGIVTVGIDVGIAVVTAVLLERACRTQLLAMAGGRLQSWSDDDEALAKRDHCWNPSQLRAGWEHLSRRMER